jgi:hypothetical protein
MWNEVYNALKEPFSVRQLSWRSGGGGRQLAYINARDLMKRLDDVVGPENWQDRYEECHGRLVCYLSIRVEGEWITKSDGAGDTNIEGEKGGMSDAFKRAGVKFGVGRYLYYLKGATPSNMPKWALPSE